MRLPRRFQDLFDLNVEVSERQSMHDIRSSGPGRLVRLSAAVLLEAAWLALAVNVFVEISRTYLRLGQTPAWDPLSWGAFFIATSLLAIFGVQLLGGLKERLSGTQIAFLLVSMLAPGFLIGRTLMYTIVSEAYYAQPVVHVLLLAGSTAVVVLFLATRLSQLVLAPLDRGLATQRFAQATLAVAAAGVLLAFAVRFDTASAAALSPLWLLVYLVSGLLFLALAPELHRAGAAEGVAVDTRERILYSLLSAALVALVGVILAAVVSPQVLALLVTGLGLLWSLLTRILLLIALPAGLLIQVVIWLVRLVVKPGEPMEPPSMTEAAEDWLQQDPTAQVGVPEWLVLALKLLPAILMLVLAWYLLRRLQGAMTRRRDSLVELEVHESTGGLLRWLSRKLRGAGEPAASVDQDEYADASPEVRRVREAFREFLKAAGRYHRPIRATETARAFCTNLQVDAPPPGETDVPTLLRKYELARYGRRATAEAADTASRIARQFSAWVDEQLSEPELETPS